MGSRRNLPHRKQLIGGTPCWVDPDPNPIIGDPLPATADIAIVGAGIMGAMVAESLTAAGYGVALLDRREPVTGSTAASTALVMWAADVPLTQLGDRYGAAGAASRWLAVHRAVKDLSDRIAHLQIDCGWIARPDVYLSGNVLGEAGLRAEETARQRVGLPSVYLPKREVSRRFGISPRAALISTDSYEVDPVKLSLGLLDRAQARGATISYRVDVAKLLPGDDGVRLVTTTGRTLAARDVILAAGYEAARWSLPKGFVLGSSFAIATRPGVAPAWHENALLWEASDPYLYARITVDGRIIVGGEDSDTVRPADRNAMISRKRAALENKAAQLLGADISADCAWAATFGRSPDGLPAAGLLPGLGRTWLACGFGGNGIPFAALASRVVTNGISRVADPDAGYFKPDRF